MLRTTSILKVFNELITYRMKYLESLNGIAVYNTLKIWSNMHIFLNLSYEHASNSIYD